ncbi:hypothetical protein FOPG_15684 [Fusarium oxysporum f. sp. conglutinans race 2 54008]|uniref:Uncharacterized protein n=1 Tax=Fusarium oxysporum f. sp. conglutinans race 2 54008 TaxID=1089457 RepID=X0GXA4_FUSOX|nr:hypothetical protein FOPG_15684 [Fusarium oxysporum f. sp. conglutinans race 2 54008]KAG6988130.1 hypothetical protein FocnCong_v003686 [Fusarium oxysporum f. sp. conglutinans]
MKNLPAKVKFLLGDPIARLAVLIAVLGLLDFLKFLNFSREVFLSNPPECGDSLQGRLDVLAPPPFQGDLGLKFLILQGQARVFVPHVVIQVVNEFIHTTSDKQGIYPSAAQ